MRRVRAIALVFALACGSSSPPALATQQSRSQGLSPAFVGLFAGHRAEQLQTHLAASPISFRRSSCARLSSVQSSRTGSQIAWSAESGLASGRGSASGVWRGLPARTALSAEADTTQPAGRSVGIDLGTTNSAVAAIVDGKPVIIRNKIGVSTTPSVVSFERIEGGEEGEVVIKVGEEAREQAFKNPASTYASVKRLIGRTCKEASGAVADASQLKLLVESGDGDAHLNCDALGRSLAPEEISCHVIRTLLEDVERELGGEKVTRAVITVPAYFNDKQRRATEAAGLLAGLERVKLLREPEAAALAYGLDKLEDELILVFDLGGGTFDVSVLEVGGGIIEVLWTGGDAFLGGDDFDLALASWLVDQLGESASSSLPDVSTDALKGIKGNKDAMSRVLAAARKAKVRLSSARAARVVVADVLPGLDLNVSVTQRQLEQRCASLLQLLAQPIRQVALMAGIELEGDDTALDQFAVGADPAATEALRAAQGGDVSDLDLKALKAAQKSGKKKSRSRAKIKAEFHRVQKQIGQNKKLRPFPAGRSLTEVVLVGGGTRMAAVPRLLRALTGIEARRTIDPDEAVAIGAAIQAGIMDGAIQGLEVLSPLQAALLRGFARKKLAEDQGTYMPLMGDPDKDLQDDDAEDWSEDEDWFDDDADMSDDDDMLVDPADEFTPVSLE